VDPRALRKATTEHQRKTLDLVWEHHLLRDDQGWPAKRRVLIRLGKSRTLEQIAALPAGALVETMSDPPSYALSLLGVLLTSEGSTYEDLLLGYLNQVRKLILSNPDLEELDGDAIAATLGLQGADLRLLGSLIQVSGLWGDHYYPGPPWRFGVPTDIEDYPSTRDFRTYLWNRAARYAKSAVRAGTSPSLARPRRRTTRKARKRSFGFIADPELRKLLERDLRELESINHKRQPKMTVVLCGVLLEGMLLDALRQRKETAGSTYARLKKNPNRDLDEWHFTDMMEVAEELGLLSRVSASLGHSLREFRNLIHPGRQLRERIDLTAGEPLVIRKALPVFIRFFEARAQSHKKEAAK